MVKKLWNVIIRENDDEFRCEFNRIKAETGVDAIEIALNKLGNKKTFKQWIQEHIDINASSINVARQHDNERENADIDCYYYDDNGNGTRKNHWIGATKSDEQ